MGKLHNPVDYNLAANPSLPKTNSPWRIYGALVLAGLACVVAWYFLRTPIRVAQPILEFAGERVVATTVVANDTSQSVTLFLRVVLAFGGPGTKSSPPRFDVVDQQDVEVRVRSRSTESVRCEFPLPKGAAPHSLKAEVRILKTVD